MSPRLSKSRFQAGLQCPKRLWLTAHAPELATPTSERQQHIFDTGHAVGELARTRFPGGVLVAEDHTQSAQALETTRALLASDPQPPAIFEATFEYGGVFVRADVIRRAGDGEWDLIEVKSGTKVKPENVTDIAVQLWVLEGAGLRIRRAYLMHLNRDYVYPGGDYDVRELFSPEDVTDQARAFTAQVPALVADMLAMLESPEPPDVRIGKHCNDPYDCDFAEYCHAFLPERPVTSLPRLNAATLDALLAAGIHAIDEVPTSFPGLTTQQREVCELVRTGEPRFVGDVARTLSGLAYPLRFLDFETLMSALPLWPGTRPWQQIPFQWSLHVLDEDGSLTHMEFLHEGPGDPRPSLTESLLDALGTHGSIIVYTSFERTRLRELASALPEHAAALAALEPRLFDLERAVAWHVRHPECLGSTSIKVVLPALAPDLTYSGLGIADGNTAALRYLHAITGHADDETRERTFAELREYCGLDTLAMVRLLEVLREAAPA